VNEKLCGILRDSDSRRLFDNCHSRKSLVLVTGEFKTSVLSLDSLPHTTYSIIWPDQKYKLDKTCGS